MLSLNPAFFSVTTGNVLRLGLGGRTIVVKGVSTLEVGSFRGWMGRIAIGRLGGGWSREAPSRDWRNGQRAIIQAAMGPRRAPKQSSIFFNSVRGELVLHVMSDKVMFAS